MNSYLSKVPNPNLITVNERWASAGPIAESVPAPSLPTSQPESAPAPTQGSQPESMVTLTFIFEAEISGYLQASDYAAGAAKLAAYTDYYTNQNPTGSFLLSIGDVIKGSSLANLSRGKPVIEIFNVMGFDAMTVGNHELDWGLEGIETLKEAQFPLLASTIHNKKDGARVDWAQPYVVIEKQGVKVGILGLLTAETPRIVMASSLANFEFTDPIEEAKVLVPLMKSEGADVIIALTHLPAYKQSDGTYAGEAIDLANQVTGIDAIICGHQGEEVELTINDIPVIQILHYGSQLGRVEIEYDINSKSVVSRTMEIIDVFGGELDIAPDATVAAIVANYASEFDELLDQVIGYATEELQADATCRKETATGNWFADAYRQATGTRIAFMNSSGLFDLVLPGPITYRRISEISPYENLLVTTDMAGLEIRELWEITLDSTRIDDMGSLQVSGMKLVYDSSNPDGGQVVDMVLDDGNPIEMDKTYTVTTVEYLATGCNGYENLTKLDWRHTGILSREAVTEYLKEVNELSNRIEGRIVDLNQQ